MGLDMYLYKTSKNEDYNLDDCEVGYWRKSNQIHNWFVKYIQNGEDDCGEYEVSSTDVGALLMICRMVMKSIELIDGEVINGYRIVNGVREAITEEGRVVKDSSVAEMLLPTTSGFFFGGTDYDEYYADDIKSTISILERALKEVDFENEKLIYTSSW